MRSCREVTALVSQGLDKKLSLGERLAVGLHLIVCAQCRDFQRQARFLRKAAQGYAEQWQNRSGKKP